MGRGRRRRSKGIYLSTQAEGRAMLAGGSRSIINVASMSGRIVNRPQLHSHYNAAKADVIRIFPLVCGRTGGPERACQHAQPRPYITPMTEKAVPYGTGLDHEHPMGRLATPDDLVGAVIFLASMPRATSTAMIGGGWRIHIVVEKMIE